MSSSYFEIMLHLKDRNGQVPYGLTFKLPEANWEGVRYSSLDTLARAAMQVGRANPYIAKKSNWPTTLEGWQDAVDVYNASICKAHGWTSYYREDGQGGPIPKSPPRHSPGLFGAAVVGVSVLSEMFGARGPIKDSQLALSRAKTCCRRNQNEKGEWVGCPKHDKGDWKRWFTIPAQTLILKTLSAIKDQKLSTELDEELHVCSACACPMKGKIWARVEHVLNHIDPEDKAALDPQCWITSEEKSLGQKTGQVLDAA